jgi:putative oxidoreductase
MFNDTIKKCSWVNTDAGLLVLRIGIGFVFILAGWMKVAHLGQTVAMFGQMGFNAFWTYVASFTELLGGIAILLGAWTRIAAVLLTITMAVAVYVTRANTGMMMTPLILIFANVTLFLTGGGAYSLAKKMCGCGTCTMCKDADVAPKIQ